MVALRRKLAFIFLDMALINAAIILTVLIKHNGQFPQTYSDNAMYVAIVTTVICISTYMFFGLYKSLWKYASIDELMWIVLASAVSSVLMSVCFALLGIAFTATGYILFALVSTFIIGGSRISYRILRRFKHFKCSHSLKDYKRVMVIGAGDAGAMVIKELKEHSEMNLKPIAVIDDDRSKHHSKIMGVHISGGRDSIKETVKLLNIDEIIIAIPSENKLAIMDILKICKETKCKLKTLPAVYELINDKVSIQHIRDVQIEDLLGRDPICVDLSEICDYLYGQVILVTGGGGSIGSELCRQIAHYNPKKLIILDIYENNAYDLQQELNRSFPKLDHEVLIASVRDRARMESIFDTYRPAVVFHAAAHKHVPLMEHNPTEAIKNNVFGTLNVAECASEFGAKRFVLISTDKAVNPTNIMGATKRIAEMIIQGINRKSKTEFVAVRFGNVLGSNGSVIPLFKNQIAQGGPVTITHPDINRFFMTIPEAAELVLQAGAMANGGEIFILDMGESVKIADLAKDLIRLSGFEPDVDIMVEYTGLRPGEKLYEELLMAEEGLTKTKHQKIHIGKPMFIDISTLKKELEKLKFVMNGSTENLKKYVEELVPTYTKYVEELAPEHTEYVDEVSATVDRES